MDDTNNINPLKDKKDFTEEQQSLLIEMVTKMPGAKHKLMKHLGIKELESANPYYKAKYAEMVKFIIDEMLEDGVNREIRYADYKMKPSSIKSILHAGALYLAEHDETPDKRYLKWHTDHEIQKTPDGLILRKIDDPEKAKGFLRSYKVVAPKEEEINLVTKENAEAQDWRSIVIEFMEKAPMGKQIKHKVDSIKENDKVWLREFFADTPDIAVRWDGVTLNLIRTTDIEESERIKIL